RPMIALSDATSCSLEPRRAIALSIDARALLPPPSTEAAIDAALTPAPSSTELKRPPRFQHRRPHRSRDPCRPHRRGWRGAAPAGNPPGFPERRWRAVAPAPPAAPRLHGAACLRFYRLPRQAPR